MQKSEIADSVSLLTGCTAIFDFYTAKAVHEQVAKRIANAVLTNDLSCYKIKPPKRWFYFAENEV